MFGRHHDDDGKQAHEYDDASNDHRRLHYVYYYVSVRAKYDRDWGEGGSCF